MIKSDNRAILLCSNEQHDDLRRYFKAKKIQFEQIKSSDSNLVQQQIEEKITNILSDVSISIQGITIILNKELCQLALFLQQNYEVQLILINPEKKNYFNQLPIIESDNKDHILWAIKNLIETGS